jgi:hypothetical protein
MNPRLGYRQILMVWLALALAQFACSVGTSPATAIPPLPTTISPASPVPPTDTPQASPVPPTTGATTTQTPAAASDRGTPDEAKAMLQKAIDHYNAVGRTQALADFTGRVAPFFDRDLYVACIDSKLVQSANGGFPNLVGSSVQPLSRAAWDAATTTAIGSVSYMWINPANGNTEPKTFFYEKVGTDVCGVGAYTPA